MTNRLTYNFTRVQAEREKNIPRRPSFTSVPPIGDVEYVWADLVLRRQPADISNLIPI